MQSPPLFVHNCSPHLEFLASTCVHFTLSGILTLPNAEKTSKGFQYCICFTGYLHLYSAFTLWFMLLESIFILRCIFVFSMKLHFGCWLVGYTVEGMYMHNWDEVEESGHCPSDSDYESMKRVCKTLGIRSHRVNFVKQYWNNVFRSRNMAYCCSTVYTCLCNWVCSALWFSNVCDVSRHH
jgi:hypothetical protein